MRNIHSVFSSEPRSMRPGIRSIDYFNSDIPLEPFLVFTEFEMSEQIFGPHPHGGVSVLTYMLPDSLGSFRNRDSLGDDSIIEPGGAHVSQAGRGLQHDEVPTVNGIVCHGMQIWINHSDANRGVEPKALHAFSSEIATVESETSVIRVVLGSYDGALSPLNVITPVSLLDIDAKSEGDIDIYGEETAFVYVLKGAVYFNKEKVEAKRLAVLDRLPGIVNISFSADAQFLFASGKPHNEPIVYGGPFVATSESQLSETKMRYLRGEMGELAPID